jgi:outer membrane protein
MALVFCLWGAGSQTLRAAVPETKPDNVQQLSYADCLLLAIEHNPEVLVAQSQIQSVEGRIMVARAVYLPKLSANAVSLPPTIYLSVSQPIFTRAMAPTFRSFPIGRELARSNVQLTIVELSYRLRASFALAYLAQELVGIIQQEVALYEERLKKAPALFEAGRMRKSDLLSLEVRAALSREKLGRFQATAETERLKLAEITGLPATDPRLSGLLTNSFSLQSIPSVPVETLIQTAMKQRIDLQILRGLKKLEEENVRITASGAYPTAGIGSGFSREFLTPGELKPVVDFLDPQSARQDEDDNDIKGSNASFVVSGSWRLVDWGDVKSQVQRAKVEVWKQEEVLAKADREIPRQVRLALASATAADRLYEQFTKSDLPQQNLTLAQESFSSGQSSQLEVLSVQEELIQYREAKLRLRYSRDLSLASLDRALGQTLQIEETIP